MRTLKFFISGQISGLDYLEAKRNFATAQEELQKIGCVKVYNPMEKIDPNLTWKEQMEICLEEIAHSDVGK